MDYRLATIDDVPSLQHDPGVSVRRVATAAEYFDAAVNRMSNRAGDHIDHSNGEPRLVNMDAVEMGVHPYIDIHDVYIKPKVEGKVTFDLPRNSITVEPNTLVVWW
jgi:hypothetical protein